MLASCALLRLKSKNFVTKHFFNKNYIIVFNPNSEFHLSLGIDYPNKSDKVLGNSSNLGGEIYIHDRKETIGCIPLGNDNIEEVFLICLIAKNNGQKNIPVHIFPFPLTDQNLKKVDNSYLKHEDIINFWKNLKTVYDYFELYRKLPNIKISESGRYEISP